MTKVVTEMALSTSRSLATSLLRCLPVCAVRCQSGFGGDELGEPPQDGGFGGQQEGNRRLRREPCPIPQKAPFSLHIDKATSITKEEVMQLFKEHNPTDLKLQGERSAYIFFNNREDLVAALALSEKEEVRRIRLSTSRRYETIAAISDTPPFRAHCRILPLGCTDEILMEILKFLEPVSAIVVYKRLGDANPFAFVEFGTKENLLKAFDLSMSSKVRGISINPSRPRYPSE